METGDNPRITLELETGADPIRGSIEQPDGSSQSFYGWLELSAVLRRVAAVSDAEPNSPQPSTSMEEQA